LVGVVKKKDQNYASAQHKKTDPRVIQKQYQEEVGLEKGPARFENHL